MGLRCFRPQRRFAPTSPRLFRRGAYDHYNTPLMSWRWAWLILPLAAIGELVAHSVILARLPDEADLEAAAELVRGDYRQGDLVVVAPEWLAQARSALGPEVMPLRDQARPNADTYERLWEVSVRGERAPEAEGLRPELERRFGRVALWRYELTPRARTVFDFVENLGEARVFEVQGDRRRPCQRRGRRWRCAPRGRDQWVGTETISDLDHRPRRCIWAHPLPRGKTLRVEFTGLPRDQLLEGHTATDYVVGRHCEPDPVDLAIEIDGRVVERIEHRDCVADNWNPFAIEVPPGPATATVAFLITAPDPARRHFCFQAQIRSPR